MLAGSGSMSVEVGTDPKGAPKKDKMEASTLGGSCFQRFQMVGSSVTRSMLAFTQNDSVYRMEL